MMMLDICRSRQHLYLRPEGYGLILENTNPEGSEKVGKRQDNPFPKACPVSMQLGVNPSNFFHLLAINPSAGPCCKKIRSSGSVYKVANQTRPDGCSSARYFGG